MRNWDNNENGGTGSGWGRGTVQLITCSSHALGGLGMCAIMTNSEYVLCISTYYVCACMIENTKLGRCDSWRIEFGNTWSTLLTRKWYIPGLPMLCACCTFTWNFLSTKVYHYNYGTLCFIFKKSTSQPSTWFPRCHGSLVKAEGRDAVFFKLKMKTTNRAEV